MASIKKMQPGQTLFEVKRNTGLSSFCGKYSTWPITIVEVNVEKNYVIASFNGNVPCKYYEPAFKKWRVNRPKDDK